MKQADNCTAGLYRFAIKDWSPRECHYLSTSIYVQMAPNLLQPPTNRVFLCSGMLTLYGLVYALSLGKQIQSYCFSKI